MQFIKSDGPGEGVKALAARLGDGLSAGKKVLWLVSGGSNIQIAVRVMDILKDSLGQEELKNLRVLIADERYGEENHKNSNYVQLIVAGFDDNFINFLPVLNKGLSFSETKERYESMAKIKFAQADIVIAQLGVGADGHTAGILPNSAAAREEKELVAGYDGGQYQRLTMTFPALRKINVAYVFAFGEGKRQTLNMLRDSKTSLAEQPAQILKKIKEVYLYNDQIGGDS